MFYRPFVYLEKILTFSKFDTYLDLCTDMCMFRYILIHIYTLALKYILALIFFN